MSEALRRHQAKNQTGGEATGVTVSTKPARPVVAAASTAAAAETYRVRSGDTLSKIAKKVYNDGNKWRVIYEANKDALANPKDLKRGQLLKIPR